MGNSPDTIPSIEPGKMLGMEGPRDKFIEEQVAIITRELDFLREIKTRIKVSRPKRPSRKPGRKMRRADS